MRVMEGVNGAERTDGREAKRRFSEPHWSGRWPFPSPANGAADFSGLRPLTRTLVDAHTFTSGYVESERTRYIGGVMLGSDTDDMYRERFCIRFACNRVVGVF